MKAELTAASEAESNDAKPVPTLQDLVLPCLWTSQYVQASGCQMQDGKKCKRLMSLLGWSVIRAMKRSMVLQAPTPLAVVIVDQLACSLRDGGAYASFLLNCLCERSGPRPTVPCWVCWLHRRDDSSVGDCS